MNETEVRKLFLIIQNSYSGFLYDEFKVRLWHQVLRDIPFNLAQRNLFEFIRNPENKYPPHPGELTRTKIQNADGPYIPNAEETRKYLAELERLQLEKHERLKLGAGNGTNSTRSWARRVLDRMHDL